MDFTLSCIYSYLACPVSGQIRKECASLPICHSTCENHETPRPCPLVCAVNGCECPTGTVIDEAQNSCVDPNTCPGMYSGFYGQF